MAAAASITLLQALPGIEADVPNRLLTIRPVISGVTSRSVTGLSVDGQPLGCSPSGRARSTGIATSCSSDTDACCPDRALPTGSTVSNSTAVSVT
ncbi:hypothetical protein AB0I51_43015 [Streptomyces sp. NPDC050549]|uniref:hypothetical protein n=1 Tax=Streptomyces sp. NPDC050549 TaxID=3155406 RepID=UPI00343B6A49